MAFPTETVYGLGANAFNAAAVNKIYAAKGRPANNPLIVHIASTEHIYEIVKVEPATRLADLLEKLKGFWPGPLSLVLPKRRAIPDSVTAGLKSVAVRIPDHPVALELLKAAGVPIAAPSANLSSYVSPTSAEHVLQSFGNKIPLIIDGGPCRIGLESTVLSLLEDLPRILRPGGVTREALELKIGPVLVNSGVSGAEPAHSPGMQAKHYSPKTKLIMRSELRPNQLRGLCGLIAFNQKALNELKFPFVAVKILSPDGDLNAVAAGLFSALRSFDRKKLHLIVLDVCEESGLGAAIMDRIRRAAA